MLIPDLDAGTAHARKATSQTKGEPEMFLHVARNAFAIGRPRKGTATASKYPMHFLGKGVVRYTLTDAQADQYLALTDPDAISEFVASLGEPGLTNDGGKVTVTPEQRDYWNQYIRDTFAAVNETRREAGEQPVRIEPHIASILTSGRILLPGARSDDTGEVIAEMFADLIAAEQAEGETEVEPEGEPVATPTKSK